jgi:hypothetical protein
MMSAWGASVTAIARPPDLVMEEAAAEWLERHEDGKK